MLSFWFHASHIFGAKGLKLHASHHEEERAHESLIVAQVAIRLGIPEILDELLDSLDLAPTDADGFGDHSIRWFRGRLGTFLDHAAERKRSGGTAQAMKGAGPMGPSA